MVVHLLHLPGYQNSKCVILVAKISTPSSAGFVRSSRSSTKEVQARSRGGPGGCPPRARRRRKIFLKWGSNLVNCTSTCTRASPLKRLRWVLGMFSQWGGRLLPCGDSGRVCEFWSGDYTNSRESTEVPYSSVPVQLPIFFRVPTEGALSSRSSNTEYKAFQS